MITKRLKELAELIDSGKTPAMSREEWEAVAADLVEVSQVNRLLFEASRGLSHEPGCAAHREALDKRAQAAAIMAARNPEITAKVKKIVELLELIHKL